MTRMATENLLLKTLRIILALALLGSLCWAGLRLYRALPRNENPAPAGASTAKFELNIVMRDGYGGADTDVELYPIEYAAVQREFVMQGRPGRSLEDYLAQQLKKLVPVRVRIDQNGKGVARLSPGHWWMRATSVQSNGELVEWRVPLTISQPVHTVELSGDNAYERAKKF